MTRNKNLLVVHGDHVCSDVSVARGCIGAFLDKSIDVCKVDARVASLQPSEKIDELLDRLGELFVTEFPNELKSATIQNDNMLVAWVVVPASSTKGGPHRQIVRLQEVLEGAGLSGVLIGSVIISPKKKQKKIH